MLSTCRICLGLVERPVELNCLHSFCMDCIITWSRVQNTCPLCRNTFNLPNYLISGSLEGMINRLGLFDSNVKNINIIYPSEKGTSKPITNNELNLLKSYLGQISVITYNYLISHLLSGNIILIQNFVSNCWWIGKFISVDNNKIVMDNSIYIQRNSGKIYNASPSRRSIPIGDNDTFYFTTN